jgi:hypothetical protein
MRRDVRILLLGEGRRLSREWGAEGRRAGRLDLGDPPDRLPAPLAQPRWGRRR